MPVILPPERPSAASGEPAPAGSLAINIAYFTRLLRAAGMPLGPGKVLDAINAASAVGVTRRQDFYWALHAVCVSRNEQRALFEQAFELFWRNPRLLERLAAEALGAAEEVSERGVAQQALQRRLADALGESEISGARQQQPQELDKDARLTWSNQEVLQRKDFEQMSAAELEQARQMIRRLQLRVPPLSTRRLRRPHPRGSRVDLRATLRHSLRSGGDIMQLQKRSRRTRPAQLVVLADISGSMAQYSRMLLHFAHALTNENTHVHTFVFGTRLTNISRQLRYRDVDEALAKISSAVVDWQGGTCIGACLLDFNRRWSRRVLAQGAVVIFISDGLERDNPEQLGTQMERLQKSCRRLIWLNPLLRYDKFQPKAGGIKALLPFVDDFRAAHNISSLSELGQLLSEPLSAHK